MSKMKEEFIKQRENAYVMGRCDDLYQEHLAELSFCELEVKRETILRCAEWIKENLNLDESSALLRPGVIADLMIKDLLYSEDKGGTL
jgi:hypothetical protein